MNKIKILGIVGSVCTVPSIFMVATSCKDRTINISDEEKILTGDDKTVIVTGTDGLKLSNINLIIDNTSTVFATVDGEVMINGETKLEFKLCDKVTTSVDNLVMTYLIDGKEGKPIKGFKFENIVPIFSVPTIEMSSGTKGVTGTNVTWSKSSSYFKLYDIVLWTNGGERLARGLSWGGYKTSGSTPIELTFYPAISSSINDTVATFSYANEDGSIKGETQVSNINVIFS